MTDQLLNDQIWDFVIGLFPWKYDGTTETWYRGSTRITNEMFCDYMCATGRHLDRNRHSRQILNEIERRMCR